MTCTRFVRSSALYGCTKLHFCHSVPMVHSNSKLGRYISTNIAHVHSKFRCDILKTVDLYEDYVKSSKFALHAACNALQHARAHYTLTMMIDICLPHRESYGMPSLVLLVTLETE